MSFKLPDVVSWGKEAEAGGDGSGALPTLPGPTPMRPDEGEARSPLLVECPLLRLKPCTSPPKRDEVELVEPVKEPGWNAAPAAPGEAGCPRGGLANPPAPGVPLPLPLPVALLLPMLGELGGKGILKDVPLLRRDPEVDPDCAAAAAAAPAGYMEMGTAEAAP